MTKLHSATPVVNPLASTVDPASPLDAAEGALSMASLMAAHGRVREARMALMLAFTSIHLAALAGADIERAALLSRAAREADAALAEAAPLDAVPTLRAVK